MPFNKNDKGSAQGIGLSFIVGGAYYNNAAKFASNNNLLFIKYFFLKSKMVVRIQPKMEAATAQILGSVSV